MAQAAGAEHFSWRAGTWNKSLTGFTAVSAGGSTSARLGRRDGAIDHEPGGVASRPEVERVEGHTGPLGLGGRGEIEYLGGLFSTRS
jgi:hypothetical protein